MYCKNCGRQLKEGTRFCDRCGQSVRKNNQNSQTTKRKEIEELKAERLNRKRRLQEKEAKQARNKKRRKSKGSVMIFIIVALLIAIVSVIIGYNMMAPNDNGLGTVLLQQIRLQVQRIHRQIQQTTYHQHHRRQIQQAKTVIQK